MLCEECVCVCAVCVYVCCVCVCVCMCPRTANHAMLHKAHCVDHHCISLYMLYSARNVFKTIIGCDCYPLLVLRLPNDFLFHLEPKVARWDHHIVGVDVNMGGYGVVDEWE